MTPDTKPAGEAVKFLAQQAIEKFKVEAEAVGALALKDAGLSTEEGWRFDIFNAVFVKLDEPASEAKE